MQTKIVLSLLLILIVGGIAFSLAYAAQPPAVAIGVPTYVYPAPVIEYPSPIIVDPSPQYPPLQDPSPNPIPPEPVFCTMDAKMCPDGSYVGRVPPSCQFAACPGQ